MKHQFIKLLTILSLVIGASVAANAQFRYAAIAGFENTNLKFKQDLVCKGFKSLNFYIL